MISGVKAPPSMMPSTMIIASRSRRGTVGWRPTMAAPPVATSAPIIQASGRAAAAASEPPNKASASVAAVMAAGDFRKCMSGYYPA